MFKLFTERNKKQTEEVDVYTYDNFSAPFRNQVFYIIKDMINEINKYYTSDNIWMEIHNRFCREKGIKNMDDDHSFYPSKIESYIDKSSDEDLLDFIDFAFHVSEVLATNLHYTQTQAYVKNSIAELNYRFQQHKYGYEFISGELIPINDMFIHKEYIKPALNLLHANGFKGAEEEYKNAFEALRNRENKVAIIEAEKAFESTMKTICLKNKYAFDHERDSAKKLIEILKSNCFFPEYTESQLNAVATALVSGAPMVRNRTSGHGQGEEVIDIPDSYAKYVIGLVAVNIVFLVQLHKEKC
ncbi:hypothetical protein JRC49_01810 [Clostridiales bacterium FE2011]|nr:hypothetical protein JRC49_01810 [Clostridiales bacterium FE2011]